MEERVHPVIAPAARGAVHSFAMFLPGLAAAIALLYYGRLFCITVIVSVMLAFLLEPFVALVMRARLPRGAAAFLVCAVALLVLYLLAFGLYTQIASLAEDLPEYSNRLNSIVDRAAARVEETEQHLYKTLVPRRFQPQTPPAEQPQTANRRKRRDFVPPAPQPPPLAEVRIHQDRSALMNSFAPYFSSLFSLALMASFVPFLVYFTLSWRDHISRSFLGIYAESERVRAGRSWQTLADMARAYVVGNVILGVMISVVSAAIFWTWHLPYWVLTGFLSGFFSLIPYVGLPLAMVPPVVSALMVYDGVPPYLVICSEVALVHLIALNLLYPAVVGGRVHLNPLTVTVALMFWGTIWGGIGLILAIPITAAIKVYLDSTQNLQGYGRLLGDRISSSGRST